MCEKMSREHKQAENRGDWWLFQISKSIPVKVPASSLFPNTGSQHGTQGSSEAVWSSSLVFLRLAPMDCCAWCPACLSSDWSHETHENSNLSSPDTGITGRSSHFTAQNVFFSFYLILLNICEVTRCVCFYFCLSKSLSSPFAFSLPPSLSLFPSSMWTLARDFIRGIPAAELQQAFPGEKAAGSRRMIKLGHYLASTGP